MPGADWVGHCLGQAPKRQSGIGFGVSVICCRMHSEKAGKAKVELESKEEEQTRMWSWAETDFGLMHREGAAEQKLHPSVGLL